MTKLRRALRRVRDRARASRLYRWAFDREDVLWISIIEPNAAALDTAPPDVSGYRGLKALVEQHRAGHAPEWHAFWNSEWAAELGERQLASNCSDRPAKRAHVRFVALPKGKWWTRPWPLLALFAAATTAVTVFLGSVSTLGDFVDSWRHPPELMLKSSDTIVIGSNMDEKPEIELLGDPRQAIVINDIRMRILADPDYPETPMPPTGGMPLPGAKRSLSVSGEAKLALPLNLPAGHYLASLSGSVHTAGKSWQTADFAPKPIPLEVRDEIGLRVDKVQSAPAAPGDNPQAPRMLIDFTLFFGRVVEPTANVRVVIKGQWISWTMREPPRGVTLERQSQNSSQVPKSAIFVVRGLPSKQFGLQRLRIEVQSAAPVSPDRAQTLAQKSYASRSDE